MLNRMFFAQNVSPALPISLGYGRLYNGYAASDSRLAPSGWRVPTLSDLYSLLGIIGYNRGDLIKETGYSHWDIPNDASNGSGFTLFGAGYRNLGVFSGLRTYGTFCASDYADSNYFVFAQYDDNTSVPSSWGSGTGNRTSGMSIRLLKNDSVNIGSLTDYDGNVYNTVMIGTQIWTKENWKCSRYNDGTSIPNVTDNATWAALTTGAMCAYNNDENNV